MFMLSLIRRFRRNNEGATAIEYGLIAALIATAAIAAMTTIGQNLETTFKNVGDDIAKGGDDKG
jgi:pilus assembly protein Flp/PilA